MSRITEKGATAPLEIFQSSTDTSLGSLVGAKFDTSDGREFVLVQNAGTALTSGTLIQGPAAIAAHQNCAASTQVAGDKTITVTLGATLATANQYAGGFLLVNAGTGIGQTLKIANHPAAALSTAVVVTLEDAIQVATAAASTKVCLVLPAYGSSNGTDVRTSGVIICPLVSNATPGVGLTGPVIGVAIDPTAASTSTVPTYGLIQTKGICSCLNDANTAIGLDVMPGTTAGSVATYVVATSQRVGTATQAGVTTESRLITLQL